MYRVLFIIVSVFFSSCVTTTTYYIVRHAEKEAGTTMTATTVKTSDVPLSEQGMKRSEGLKNQLKNKKIKYIYSTNTIRSRSTAKPLSEATGIPIKIYNAEDKGFLQVLKNTRGNVLVVGHSNTVDDLVNGLMNKKILEDLTDSQYGDLFIVHKKNNAFSYEATRFEPVE